jgi:hypothetical protein
MRKALDRVAYRPGMEYEVMPEEALLTFLAPEFYI